MASGILDSIRRRSRARTARKKGRSPGELEQGPYSAELPRPVPYKENFCTKAIDATQGVSRKRATSGGTTVESVYSRTPGKSRYEVYKDGKHLGTSTSKSGAKKIAKDNKLVDSVRPASPPRSLSKKETSGATGLVTTGAATAAGVAMPSKKPEKRKKIKSKDEVEGGTGRYAAYSPVAYKGNRQVTKETKAEEAKAVSRAKTPDPGSINEVAKSITLPKPKPKNTGRRSSVPRANPRREDRSAPIPKKHPKGGSKPAPIPRPSPTPHPEPNYDDLSFGKAFNKARKGKMKEFNWRGKRYTTRLKGESRKEWLANG